MRKLLTRAIIGAGLAPAAADAAMQLALLVGDGWVDDTLPTLSPKTSACTYSDGATIKGEGLPDFAIAPVVLNLAGGLAGDSVAIATDGVRTPLFNGLALWGAERGFVTAVVDAATNTVTIAGGADGALWQTLYRNPPNIPEVGTKIAQIMERLAPLMAGWHESVNESNRMAVLCLHKAIMWEEAGPTLQSLDVAETLAPSQVAERLRRPIVEGFRLSPDQFEHLSWLAKRSLVPPEIEPIVNGQTSAIT